ncbi:MAG: hypothetical protein FWD47_10165 [Treponema sp.]|nr:hypothetical protein [Treponema sp.]
MSKICAVCKEGRGPTKCEICGFTDNGAINREFINDEDANYWLETVVKSCRIQWEAKKREVELLAQVEEFRKKIIDLSEKLETSENNIIKPSNLLENTAKSKRFAKKMTDMTIVLTICVVAIIIYVVSLQSNIVEKYDTSWFTKNGNASTFTIKTAEQLAGLAHLVNNGNNFDGKTITLTQNIDLSKYDNWVPIGTSTGDFSGTFNGGGYIISNLTINSPDDNDQGLFGRIKNGKVENLGLDSVNIRGRNNVGGVAGIVDSGNVTNCYSIGTINSTKNSVGGVVGLLYNNSNIANSFSTATINGISQIGGVVGIVVDSGIVTESYFTGAINGINNFIGGVAGVVHHSSSVTNCYSVAAVNGNNDVGGVAGVVQDNSNVSNSYSGGLVKGTLNVGGVVGYLIDSSNVSNSYSTSEVTGEFHIGGIVGVLGNSSITNSAALNSHVSGDFRISRVLGVTYSGTTLTLSNNVAFVSMKNRIDTTAYSFIGMADRSGGNITAASIRADRTIGGRFTQANGWTTEPGKLPGLGGKAVDMPQHLSK